MAESILETVAVMVCLALVSMTIAGVVTAFLWPLGGRGTGAKVIAIVLAVWIVASGARWPDHPGLTLGEVVFMAALLGPLSIALVLGGAFAGVRGVRSCLTRIAGLLWPKRAEPPPVSTRGDSPPPLPRPSDLPPPLPRR